MKHTILKNGKLLTLLLFLATGFMMGCDNEEVTPDMQGPEVTGNAEIYELVQVGASGVEGEVTFQETPDNETVVTISLTGTPADGTHPAHIHFNSALIGGDIAISLEPVNGETGQSQTVVSALDDGSSISYEELIDFDGYINVHLSAEELETVVAQGDIGSNELTGESIEYPLDYLAEGGITGSIVFEERINGFAKATISLTGTPEGGVHPAHIHANSAAIGGGIIYSFNPVNGDTGMSMTDTRDDGDGNTFTYAEIPELDAYVNVHLSAEELQTVVAQGDIGTNALTGESKEYALDYLADGGITGTVTFEERINGFALATIDLTGTPDGGLHPAHIHMNSAAIGGGIIYTFNSINGTTGMSMSDTRADSNEVALTYAEILEINGYVNVHESIENLSVIVAQGDIGANELTGESKEYALDYVAGESGITGNITFEERVNGFALATIALTGTPDGGSHPAHIHANSAAQGGGILFTFNPVNGDNGMSITDTRADVNDSSFSYNEVLSADGYVNVHLSANDLATIVAQGDIGVNEFTGESTTYTLNERDVAGISGTITFQERESGFALATIELTGTPDGGMHPAHIHENSASETGPILFTFNPVVGDTGLSTTETDKDGETAYSYADILSLDGYVNVHLSMNDLATIVAQGNIGSNVM